MARLRISFSDLNLKTRPCSLVGILPQEPRVEQDLDGRNWFSYGGSLVEKLACESAA